MRSSGVVCPACGTALPAQARFCFACGVGLKAASRHVAPAPPIPSALRRLIPPEYVERVMAAQGRLRGERRVVTILFSDIKDSTAMSESLDPEDVMAIMNGAFEVLIEPVYRYEGTLARLMGDAILAFFGAPIAHEDDPVRACRAALEIVEGAGRYSDRLQRERGLSGFNVRVGINTGIVVVGEVGADLRVEYTAMGDAVNLAARMEGAAEPGTILITEGTWRLVSHLFRTESVGALQVKGRSEAIRAHRLVAAAPASDGESQGQRPRSPLVGRAQELERLKAACANLTNGHGGRIAIVADPGLGKTRLVDEARASRPPGVAWAGGRAISFGAARGYGLAQRVLISLLGLDAEDPARGLQDALRRVMPDQSGHGAAYLAQVLDVDDGTPRSVCAASPDIMRRRVVQAFVETVRACAERQPLVMVWEDLQWIDPSSLELLRALLPLPDAVPLLLVLAFRPEEGTIRDYHRQLVKRYGERYQVIELPRLTRQETTTLLDSLVANEKPPAWLTQHLVDRMEGNPFYVEEWVSALKDGSEWQARRDRETNGSGPEVPTTLHAAVLARLDRLPPDAKRVLQVAAVVGRVFPVDVLIHVLGNEYSPAALRQAIKDLERRRILHRITEGRTPEYGFAGALMTEVAAGSLLLAERRRLHRLIAESLETLRASRLSPLASTLAEQFEQAGLVERALEYWLRAAGRGARLAADAEALACYQRALRLAGDSTPVEVRFTIHEGLADAACRVANYPMANRHYDLALGLALDRCGRIAILRKLGSLYERSGRYSEALTSFQAALDTMGRDLDEAELSRIYSGLGLVHSRLGAQDAALQMTQLALVLQEALGDEVAIAQSCNSLGIVRCQRAEFETAIDCHRRALATWERLGDHSGRAASHNNLGLVHASLGDHGTALDHYRLAASFFEQAGNAHGVARACDNLGRTCFALGREDEAMRHLGRAVAILDELAVNEGEPVPEMWQSGAW